jgi:CRP-like cAMP-binding protein
VAPPPSGSPARAPVIPLYRADSRHPQASVCAACGVRAFALFGALDEAGLDRIHTHIADIELPAGRPLLEAGVRGSAVYTLREGVLRFERVTERGDRRIVRLAGRGALIGQEALVRRPHADDAVACTPVQLCRIPVTLVEELSQTQGALVRELMQRWQRALEEAEAWLAELSAGPARRRMLRLLARLAEFGSGERIWLPRRDEMGAMLGMTVETASRLVSGLRREGVLAQVDLGSARLDAQALAEALRRADAD